MIKNTLSILIGGEAGAGITRSGFLFAKACLKGGLKVFGINDYQSLIRGGHNFYIARVNAEEVYSQTDKIDMLLALNEETIVFHKNELASGGCIIYDGEEVTLSKESLGKDDLKIYSVPLKRLVKELEGEMIMKNTVALGAAIALLDYDLEALGEVLKASFKPKVAELNLKAAKRGYDFARRHYGGDFGYRLERIDRAGKPMMFLTGSEAVGLGAIRAGCKFYAAYPMTPATGVLHFMAANERDYEMIVFQAESEIAAINMVTGASFAGARAMTATSGGGFCLMSEGLGMAAMSETPIVVMVAQRPGPSTGLPTYTAQGDLRFVIHASQGEFPRVVIAPGDVKECYYMTIKAFDLAERFQIPVIILTDKYLVERHETEEIFGQDKIEINRGLLLPKDEYVTEDEYKRYRFTDSGISPRALPGTKGAIIRNNSSEHNESGYTIDDPESTMRMNDKRFKKLTILIDELENYWTTKLYGPGTADITILGWGSTKGPIREAMKLLSSEGLKINYLQIMILNPFPTVKVKRVLKSAKKVVVVENNKTSQLSSLIREYLLMSVDYKILKYDGRPFNPRELARRMKEVL